MDRERIKDYALWIAAIVALILTLPISIFQEERFSSILELASFVLGVVFRRTAIPVIVGLGIIVATEVQRAKRSVVWTTSKKLRIILMAIIAYNLLKIPFMIFRGMGG